MMGYVFPVLAIIVLLVAPLVAHEFGHWLAARLCGAATPVFSLGFGNRHLVIGNWLATQFRLSAIPIGGYVRIEMDSLSAARQFFILSAGIIANACFAMLVYCAIAFAQGDGLAGGIANGATSMCTTAVSAVLWLLGIPGDAAPLPDGSWLGFSQMLAFINLIMATYNILPFRLVRIGFVTDGCQLVLLAVSALWTGESQLRVQGMVEKFLDRALWIFIAFRLIVAVITLTAFFFLHSRG